METPGSRADQPPRPGRRCEVIGRDAVMGETGNPARQERGPGPHQGLQGIYRVERVCRQRSTAVT